MNTVEAVYQNGVFKPASPIALAENQRVQLQVWPLPATDFRNWLEDVRELQKRIVAEHGVLPDSTPLIAEDRRRDG